MTTLHRLLWGPTSEASTFADWEIRTWEVPAVGLPSRVAAFLFLGAGATALPADWEPSAGPLTWTIGAGDRLLAAGRRYQLGYESTVALQQSGLSLPLTEHPMRRSVEWEVEPHEAYFLPLAADGGSTSIDRDGYAFYCDVLLLLTALDGGEATLDRLAFGGAGTVPFEDRWAWRSRIHLPSDTWQAVERALRWSEAPSEDSSQIRSALVQSLQPWTPEVLRWEDFAFERIDLRLETTRDAEVVRTVRPPDATDGDLPDPLLIDAAELQETLVVRIAQVSRWPGRQSVTAQFPAMDPAISNHVMQQVAAAFQSPSHGQQDREPDLVLFPELSVPQPEVGTVRDLVAHTGRASLAGFYWRVLPPAYAPSGSPSPGRMWFVNEAELVLPVGHEDNGPTSVRWYRVRKPIPAQIESGLAQALTNLRGTTYSILPGQRWYRFVHPCWGDFTIAICADLLDAAPWRSLRGEILHLFMVAFNKDVDLFESLTWVRAYENYVNLVSVNHGRFGGSFLWTPRHSHGRELARLRGGKLFVIADVELPVQHLLEQQRTGVQQAVDVARASWAEDDTEKSDFKAPPPGFTRRALRLEEP